MSMIPAMLAIQAKALETRYNGYRFRSRLEARWAVFFDAVGIKYRYEYQSFNLGNGKCYLPDFWLPELKHWIEIKPFWPNNQECEKAIRLCIGKQQRVTILAGDVWEGTYKGILYGPYDLTNAKKAKEFLLHRCPHLHWRSPNHVMYMPEEDASFRVNDFQRGFVCRDSRIEELLLKDAYQTYESWDEVHDYIVRTLAIGFTAARSARFEYGERGRA